MDKVSLITAIKNRVGTTGYTDWYIGVTDNPGLRKLDHAVGEKEVSRWYDWLADSEKDAHSVENHFIELGMKGGAGGISEEFRQAGFEVLLGMYCDPNSVRTLQRRHGRGVEFRIKDLSADRIRREGGNRDIAVLTASPPYRAFSTASAEVLRSQSKPPILRNPLNRFYRGVLRIVKELQSPFFVIRNIRKMFAISDGRVKNEIRRKRDGAYDVLFYHENTADFEVRRQEDVTLSRGTESASVTIIDFKSCFRVCA